MATATLRTCASCEHWGEPVQRTVAYNDPNAKWGACRKPILGGPSCPMPTPDRHTCSEYERSKEWAE